MKLNKIIKILPAVVLVILVVLVTLNYQTVLDFTRGLFYAPSYEMVEIRAKLDLTTRGELVFNASAPALMNEEDFNAHCHATDEMSAVLGCYTEQKIYVYHVKSEELKGIVELTTAHELLHAVYERMSDSEKEVLKADLEKVYQDNREVLDEEIKNYDSAKRLEEIYVRAGTEIAKLPEKLEKHFAEIFNNQDKVVTFYEGYIKIFRELKAKSEKLNAEIEGLAGQIKAKIAEYEAGASWLFDEINELIDLHNEKVEEYNNNILRRESLQNLINSHVKVEGI